MKQCGEGVVGGGQPSVGALPGPGKARDHQGRLCTFSWEAVGRHNEVGTVSLWCWAWWLLAFVTLCTGP